MGGKMKLLKWLFYFVFESLNQEIQCVGLLFDVQNHHKIRHKKSSITVPHHDLDKEGCSI